MSSRRALGVIAAALAGALFGLGLLVAGMTDPAHILGFLGFLDTSRTWDPTLMFTLAGAIPVYRAALLMARPGPRAPLMARPWFADLFHLPTRRDLDPPLVIGAAVFGVGWGLGGLCPGPAIVSAASGQLLAIAFVPAMLLGMAAASRVQR